jgi:tRNA(adenine34) deaminase
MKPDYMTQALTLAREAFRAGEIPVGALVVLDGQVIASASNKSHDPTAHAEMLAIQAACKALGVPRLPECDLYVTLEPCPMCAAAIAFARLRRVYFGAYDPKGGGVEHGAKVLSHTHHKPEVYGGIDEEACGAILKEFFRERRE